MMIVIVEKQEVYLFSHMAMLEEVHYGGVAPAASHQSTAVKVHMDERILHSSNLDTMTKLVLLNAGMLVFLPFPV